jgi:hypothetical protein
VLIAGCDARTQKSGRPDPIYIGEFIGDKIQPEIFGDGTVRCSGKNLVAQGFSGGMDRHTKIEYIGKIKADYLDYYIYYFSHVANHGSYRIIILENPCKYFGSYSVDDRPVGVSGRDIVFGVPGDLGNVIHFSGISPPARVIINGHMTDLSD